IKIDCGMHRLGFNDIEDFKKALHIIKKCKSIKLAGVFTHFAESNETYYIEKKQIFDKYLRLCPANIIKHCSNSLASRFNSLQYDMVRVGLSLYGYGESKLKKVLQVKSKVISVRKVKGGEYIGYSGGYKCDKDCIIATVFLGYYDGINRKLSNKCFVKINNQNYKIVGNICMDMFMVLVDETVKVGDEVIVFDDADYWAKIIDTIPYEILTSLKSERCEIKIKDN
ncbi:MAG: alanine racemase, partial [Christensenellales bacterium]